MADVEHFATWLDELIQRGSELPPGKYPDWINTAGFVGWTAAVDQFLIELGGPKSVYYLEFDRVSGKYGIVTREQRDSSMQVLLSLRDDLTKGRVWVETEEEQAIGESEAAASHTLIKLFDRFHQAVRQLRQRYDSRSTLDVEDEYDVQNLLHVLLRLYFDDIRAEEWTPSYAGKCSRVDFLLKTEQCVIETKMARRGLTHRELGDQLIVDIERYQMHPDCKELWCFVYDPSGHIVNPRGIEADLARNEPKLSVTVVIRPI